MARFKIQERTYDTSLGLMLVCIQIARDFNHDLSDFVVDAVIEAFGEQKYRVWELLNTCEHPKFIRYAAGWHMQF